MGGKSKYILTGCVVLLAMALVLWKYWDEVSNPWTRDGQVAAQIVKIAPRVSGPIVNLPIIDNQFVKKGDLLFEIDPSIYKAKLEYAKAGLANTKSNVKALKREVEIAEAQVEVAVSSVNEARSELTQATARQEDTATAFERNTKLLKSGVISKKEFDNIKAEYEIDNAKLKSAKIELSGAKSGLLEMKGSLAKAKANLGLPGDDNAKLRLSRAELHLAQLNLEYTKITAPVDGYVTSLQLRVGSQMIVDKPVLALVDVNSYWVYGFFQEDAIKNILPRDKAIVTLMGYTNNPLRGEVESIGWGIAQENGSNGYNLLPTVKPTFEWIRLAQRVPVRVKLLEVPVGVELRVGTTASVVIKTGTGK